MSQTCSMHGKRVQKVQPGHKRYTELEDGGTKGCLPTPQLDANLFCRQSRATHIAISTQVLATPVFC